MKTPMLLVSTSFGTQVLGLNDGARVWSVRSDAGRDHLVGIVRNLDALLDESGVKRGEIASILADAGPGSFTGVRIGMTVARTLAQSFAVPIGCVTSVQVLAASVRANLQDVYGIKDAGRGRIYAAGWRFIDGQEPSPLIGLRDAEPEEWFASAGSGVFAGDAVGCLERYARADRIIRTMDAPTAEDYFQAARVFGITFGSWSEAVPVYVRKSDAEMKRKA